MLRAAVPERRLQNCIVRHRPCIACNEDEFRRTIGSCHSISKPHKSRDEATSYRLGFSEVYTLILRSLQLRQPCRDFLCARMTAVLRARVVLTSPFDICLVMVLVNGSKGRRVLIEPQKPLPAYLITAVDEVLAVFSPRS
jgi:hypothetical protein